MALVFAMLGMAFAAFIKGAVGFGFPSVATPLLALFLDGKTAIGMLVLPNIAMDVIQSSRTPGFLSTLKRHWPLYLSIAVGTVFGTKLLASMSPNAFGLVLGITLLVFVAVNLSPLSPRVPPNLEGVLGPLVGLGAGVVGGVTNAGGFFFVIYFHALGLVKHDFVRSISIGFLVYKAAQFLAFLQFGLMTGLIFWFSLFGSVFAVATFSLGLKAQDRFDQATFNRAVLALLAVIATWMIIRSLRG